MKSQILRLAAGILVLSAMSTSAAIRYVDVGSTKPTSPYSNWTTAAKTIQDAVDAAVAGDQILVTNGVYQIGGRVVFGAMTNRVAVNKAVTVQSVNGAAVTVIRGFQVPETTNGDSAIRCVYLTKGAALVGFTLSSGATRSSGDGDELHEQSGGGVWSESTSAVISNCILISNSAAIGGGAVGGTLNNCTLTANSASLQSGGADTSTLNNCALIGNSAYTVGGGAWGCTLNNCTVSGNSAGYEGGGTSESTLNNCTLTANSATVEGGGAYGCMLTNCIVYYNTALMSGDNYFGSCLSYSCTTPLPPEGVGNISAKPQLSDLSHLTADSPCRGVGSAAYATGLDIDGETWLDPPSIGCDDYYPSAVTGSLGVSIQTAYTNVIMGFTVNFTAAIGEHAIANRWEFDDGTVVTNRPSASHNWPVGGEYSVVFRAYNDTYPDGVQAMVIVHVVAQPVHYVAPSSVNPVAPYTSWATAATNIQDGVDAASVAGALVLVTNGVYQTVAVTKPLVLRSVNGAAVSVIQGPGRCVYLADGAALVGFTLTRGALGLFGRGAGVRCESPGAVVSNCVLTGNSVGTDGSGSGAYGGTLNNCTLLGNSATDFSWGGGGARFSTLNNCIVYYNSAQDRDDNYSESVLSYSCTTPLPTNGLGNLAKVPLFVNSASGNLRLQPNSPCINAGSNASAPAGLDLDFNSRIGGGTVDIGAYEFQTPTSVISYAWLQQYGLRSDGSADFVDPDGDGLNDWQEWRCQTDPTNALSALRLVSISSTGTNVTVSWQSVAALNYFLERSTNLAPSASFAPFVTNILGQPDSTTCTDTNAVGTGPFFYRIGVR